MGKRLTQEEKNELVEAYLGGKTLKEAGDMFGVSTTVGSDELKKRGLRARTTSEIKTKYKINESFFDVIDTEEKAYWLGFITADGCITNGNLFIGLKYDDINHLEKFRKSVNAEQPVRVGFGKRGEKFYKKCSITIHNKSFVKKIKKLGITENKSFTATICPNIPETLESAYWRGLIDGDGSFGIYETKRGYTWCQVDLVGSRSICESFKKWVTKISDRNPMTLSHASIFRVRYGGRTAPVAILKELYENSTIFLSRKYLKFLNIVERDNSKIDKRFSENKGERR